MVRSLKLVLFFLLLTVAAEAQVGPLMRSNNLSDVPTPATARTNLGLPASATTDTTNASNIASGTLATARLTTSVQTRTVGFLIDGGGSTITTGIKGDLDFAAACTITGVKVRLDQSGSIVIDLWKLAFSTSASPTVANTITASDKPTVSSTIAVNNTSLTGWGSGVNVSAGDVLRFNVDSITTATRATVTITCLST